MEKKKIKLPCYGIVVVLNKKDDDGRWIAGNISSDLKEEEDFERDEDIVREGAKYNAAIDALESLILAHACAGIDIESPAYVEGIETAVEAIGNNA